MRNLYKVLIFRVLLKLQAYQKKKIKILKKTFKGVPI